MKDLAEILGVFNGSNGEATRALYKKLEALGPAGVVAVNLFRACKVSGRAKQYRGSSKGEAYGTKEWSIENLCHALGESAPGFVVCSSCGTACHGAHAIAGGKRYCNGCEPDGLDCLWIEPLVIEWGWGIDRTLKNRGDPHHHVLYVDLPTGQVSFHTGSRGAGPDYAGAWDGERFVAKQRICRWCATLFGLPVPAEAPVPDPAPVPLGPPRSRGVERESDPRLSPERDLFGPAE